MTLESSSVSLIEFLGHFAALFTQACEYRAFPCPMFARYSAFTLDETNILTVFHIDLTSDGVASYYFRIHAPGIVSATSIMHAVLTEFLHW
jgi:hypothetical protein